MTKVKFCGMTGICDIQAANELKPDYIGFVFAPKSRRYVEPAFAGELKKLLDPEIKAVGVFMDEDPETVANLLNQGVIDLAQLHGCEDEDYIMRMRKLTGKPLIKAFRMDRMLNPREEIMESSADYVLVDSGAGSGQVFNWNRIRHIKRPFFLAGGLKPSNVKDALDLLQPYALDVSSGIETEGKKDKEKMKAFLAAVEEKRRDEVFRNKDL